MSPQDEARLNDWIEGVLPPNEAEAVARSLERDPRLAEVVRAMQADRDALIALPEPVVPEALRAAVEAAVDRSLLAPEVPSIDVAAWRSRHRKSPVWLAPRRLAAAAAILVVIGGGLVTLRLAGIGTANEAPAVADAGSALAGDDDPAAASPSGPESLFLVDGAVLVHAPPADPGGTSMTPAPDRGGSAPVADVMAARVPGVRLAVAGPDARRQVAELLRGLAGPDGPAVSVTRNLTAADLSAMDGAGRPLTAEYQNARRGSDDDWIAGWSDRARAEFGGGLAKGPAERTSGVVVAGDVNAMPAWGEQLVFSEVGAEWTLIVPADRLEAVLAELATMSGGRSQLIGVDAGGWRTLDDPATWRAMRAALMAAARSADPGRTIRIPISVVTDADGG